MITRARRRTRLVALCSVSVGMLLAGAPGAQAYVPPPAGGLAALGNNQFSNLGTSPDTDPHPAPIYFTTPGTGPVASTAASYHTSFVLSGSELYGFGDNSDGQLAQPVATQGSQNLNHPTKVALPSGAGSPVRVAASNDFTMALTNSNNLYAWGLNANGELGRTPDNTAAPTPTKVTIPVGNGVPVDVSTGSHHTLVLTSTGKVLTFGDDYYGELGYADTSGNGYDATPAALALPGNQTVTAVSAGATDSLVLTSDGKVYGFGDNSAGQLGTSGGMTTNPTPAVLPLPAGVTATQISAGGSANFILGSDGNVYATGEDDYGQAGLSPFVTAVTTPTAMSMPAGTAPVLRVVGAGISGYVITKTGQLVSWGNNADGQLGTSSTAKASLPVIVTIFNDTLDQVPIGSAGQTVFALASNVKVTNTSLPSGQAGSAYSATVTTSGGYQAGGVNTVAAAGLPSGLSLSPAGMISGTPTAAGSSTVSLTVTDPEV